MNKEKWLLKEIGLWEQETLINAETADMLKGRYAPKKNISLLIALFSIIGSLLIGAGVILILARNWYFLPLFLRVALAFLPLLVSQGLAVYVVKRKYDSPAWRESAAILVMASVFAAVAIVGQVFHLPSDYAVYVLTCGLLSLPMIYILSAAAPLIVYYWAIMSWAVLEQVAGGEIILIVLFAAVAAFVFINKKQESARLSYMIWLTLAAGFAAVLILGIMLDSSLLLIVLCYFALLFSVAGLPGPFETPFKAVGLIGCLITASVLTYERMWWYVGYVGAGGSLLAGGLIAAALFFAVKSFKSDRLKFSFSAALIFLCVLRFIWVAAGLDFRPYDFIFMILANLILLSVGAGFIVHGVKHTSLFTTNIGMITVCALVVMRFFDSGMDFLWRGIVFLALGAAFLTVNLKILRGKKRLKAEVEL